MAARADSAAGAGDTPALPWSQRAAEVGARAADPAEASARLAELWAGGRLAGAFDPASLQRLAGYLQFVHVGAGRRVIEQDEPGDFMLIVLHGTLAVERAPAHLAESQPGDVLGEMAMLDHGPRFSRCTTKTPCLLAVLETNALARLMREDAHLALVLVGALARRLSLRVRQVSARLSALLGDA
jgi:CRP/FNR family transcriptional regulator, cyclic AMP receptor protein